MRLPVILLLAFLVLPRGGGVSGFSTILPSSPSRSAAAAAASAPAASAVSSSRRRRSGVVVTSAVRRFVVDDDPTDDDGIDASSSSSSSSSSSPALASLSRRSLLRAASSALVAVAATTTTITTVSLSPDLANAAVGTLPEFADSNAILQSITIDVTDKGQLDETVAFFTNSFDGMKVLREGSGNGKGGVRDVWLGFGPETLSIPPAFTIPVSSPSRYGGHASLHLRYDPTSSAPLYRRSPGEFNEEPAAGDSVAYLQIGVPLYRVSAMRKYGGNVLDAYGWANVVSPAGLPVRGVVGIRNDPMMFVAVNCDDVGASEEFYARLGFARQEYPYARLNKGQGQFEPPQPPKSVYISPSPNSMGILLLQNDARRNRKRGGAIAPNPVLRSLNVVYAPQEGETGSGDDDAAAAAATASGSLKPRLMDPSSVPISFVPQDSLEREIRMTAIPESP